MANPQTFTRLQAPANMPEMQTLVTDIYNKIEAVQGQTQGVPATIPTTAQIQQIATAVAVPAAAAAVPSALNALIPIVLTSPNTSGLEDENGNAVSLADQAVVFWNIGGSDAGVLYQYSAANTTWTYVSGMVARTQANLATLAGLLGVADTGLLVDVTDFAHILKWTGTAWAYADPSDPAGRVEMFLVDPNPTTGWHLLDGTAGVAYLKTDGTTATITLPDLVSVAANAAYPKMGSPASATPNAAVLATFGTTAVTATGAVNAFTSILTEGEPRNLVMRPWMRV